MKPLIVLLAVFLISLFAVKTLRGEYEFALPGRIAMSAMLAFTSIAHFAFTKGMSMMLPDFIPCKTEIIYLTGVVEIAAAIGLLVPAFSVSAAWLLIVFFIALLPANIYAAIKHIDYQKGTLTGNGLNYLWFRIPLQVLFIVWTYISSIKL
jgi:uncharacterized membrane protein